MEGSQRPQRDINELLTHGFFTTSRARSPSKPSSRPAPSYLYAQHEPTYERSRSRGRKERGPRPTVEDEVVSLARETSASSKPPSYDPPLRGIIDQIPIILEAEVGKTEAARLQTDSVCKETDKEKNTERRFVFVPRFEAQSSNSSGDDSRHRKESRKKEASQGSDSGGSRRQEERKKSPPPLERRRSRQDLPSLETKLPKNIPPTYRRSASSFTGSPNDVTPKATAGTPKTSGGEYFLSPDMLRRKENINPSSPRHASLDSRTGSSTGNRAPTHPGTPLSDPRSSRSVEPPRTRRDTNERSPRPKKLSEEYLSRKLERGTSNYSERPSTGHSSKSRHSKGYYSSSSDEDLADSDDDRKSRRSKAEQSSKKTLPINDYNSSRSNRSSYDRKASSKLNSPSISPSQTPTVDDLERSQTFPRSSDRRPSPRPESPYSAVQGTPRGDKLNPFDTYQPRPVSRNGSSNMNKPMAKQSTPYPTTATMPVPIPTRIDLHSPGETLRSPSIPQYEDQNTPKPGWQPVPFQPPPQNLEKPVGSYRRFSEDVEKGSIAPLPACPRMSHTRGRNDWLTLPNCPSFNICPSCFTSIIGPTEFGGHFVQAAPRPPDASVQCDFGSSPWYRIAWLLTIKERRRDLKLFYGLADVAATEAPCLGNQEGIRKWHSIIDTRTGGPVHNFDVCHNCVKSVETLLPTMRGTFIRNDKNGAPPLRICDFSVDSKRFVQYFDALEVTADRANRYNASPDLRDLASLARRLSRFPECEQDKDRIDRKWYIITQLPEFTVCEECFDEVVWPELDEGKAIPMLFQENMVRLPRASCQLYSAKMRGVFRVAVDSDDFKFLASKVRERKGVEVAYKADLGEVRRGAVLNPGAAAVELRRLEDEWRRWK